MLRRSVTEGKGKLLLIACADRVRCVCRPWKAELRIGRVTKRASGSAIFDTCSDPGNRQAPKTARSEYSAAQNPWRLLCKRDPPIPSCIPVRDFSSASHSPHALPSLPCQSDASGYYVLLYGRCALPPRQRMPTMPRTRNDQHNLSRPARR